MSDDSARSAPSALNATNELRLVTALASALRSQLPTPHVERVTGGVSTRVYRLRLDGEKLYLRVLPEEGASFAPEATAHRLARATGARVPDIMYLHPCHPEIGRSVMVTSEILGEPVWRRPFDDATREILREAGRDLARVNSVQVGGFGWIRRDAEADDHLLGEHTSQRAFALEYLETDLAALARHGLSCGEADAIRAVIARRDDWLDGERARLAHGDFDVTHIFQRNGRYTGIIDFGEIRGADTLYDLGHFRAHDGETLPALALPYLLAGYAEIAKLPDEAPLRITLASLLITLRALGRAAEKRPERLAGHWGWRVMRRELAALA